MKDFVVFSLGCKVNQVEGQSLAETLVKAGFSISFNLEPAKSYILNTCSITAEADRKSRQLISRALRLNADAKIFVLGCSSQFDDTEFLNKVSVRFVSGAAGKSEALRKILQFLKAGDSTQKGISAVTVPPAIFEPLDKPFKSRTRAYIKVQDGCDCFCSYCIVPYLRGRSRSRNLNDIINEAVLLSRESQELIITGINLSDYRIGGEPALTQLIDAFKVITTRKRLGSLGIHIITDELLSAMRSSAFCTHFHLSVQSGCDSVLKRMNRHYTVKDILTKVELIRTFFPNAGITADIITGFPGETDADFLTTVQTIQKAAFSSVHIFPYSERKNTKAVTMENSVEKSVRRSRATELGAVCQRLKVQFLEHQIGQTANIYMEESGVGYTENYIKVYSSAAVGEIVKVKLLKKYKNGLLGELVV